MKPIKEYPSMTEWQTVQSDPVMLDWIKEKAGIEPYQMTKKQFDLLCELYRTTEQINAELEREKKPYSFAKWLREKNLISRIPGLIKVSDNPNEDDASKQWEYIKKQARRYSYQISRSAIWKPMDANEIFDDLNDDREISWILCNRYEKKAPIHDRPEQS